MANIGKSIVFKGELTGDEDLEIEGSIEGRIDLPKGQLTIGAHGRVKAEITAKAVVIVGKVTGNVKATERLEVQSSGIVEGDLSAPRLLIQEGAVVNGAIDMGAKSAAPSQSTATGAKKEAAPPVAAAAGAQAG